MSGNQYTIHTAAERPELSESMQQFGGMHWPEFIRHSQLIDEYFWGLYKLFPEYQLGLVDRSSGELLAIGNSLPVHFEGPLENLPDRGVEWGLKQGVEDRQAGRQPTIQSAFQIVIRPDLRNLGLSSKLVEAMKAVGRSHGLSDLVAAVRPNLKWRYPHMPMEEYIKRVRDDGLPEDDWIRVHVRLGAVIVRVCTESMYIDGTIAQWEGWTGRKFTTSGPQEVEQALVPVMIDLENDRGVYIEPNVWMRHPL